MTLALIHGRYDFNHDYNHNIFRLQAKDFVRLSKLDSNDAKLAFQTLVSSNLICSVGLQDSRTAIDLVMEDVRIELESKGPALTSTEIKKVGAVMKSKRKGDELELAEKRSKLRRYRSEDWNDEALEGSKFFKINVLQFHILLRGQVLQQLYFALY